ncbi:hypothetical protein NAT51_02960 [Flavobacterium amniphilum]|uniref:hypothetical protein n=1 Tax=Flavobacterium amniphilum TaxID=1834035 RepID=UPI00202AB26F|nr:hypothetical protein [Flavobacterium amniphilum]MCL9804465.1 hypothetical protein [Flavobacterium amniphilum]
MNAIPYPYYFYGSSDSTDKDVIIVIPKEEMPSTQEERKRFVLSLQQTYNFDWNATLAVIEEGIMVDTIYTKSWIDSLNNALFQTYHLHEQLFPLPIDRLQKRNKTLSVYKAVRTVLTFLTRTDYRKEIKPVLKGIHDFNDKITVIRKIDFMLLDHFNQKNANDSDIWKIIAFYVVQNMALIRDGIEIYTKTDAVAYWPEMHPFIYREAIGDVDKQNIQKRIAEWLAVIEKLGSYRSENGKLYCNNEVIDMLNEKY